MRRSYKLLFALAAVLLLLGSSALADTLRFGTVTGGSTVNLRAGASTGTARLGVYKRNTWMRVIGENGNWYKVVAPDGKTGYMRKDLVFISSAAKGIVGIVDVNSSLTLRSKPSTSGRALGAYRDGTPCILLSESGDWYHVTVDGKAGYFLSSYLDKKYMTYSPDVATVVSANGGAVNLRKGPGTQYGVTKSVKNGSYVMILQKGQDWWKISANGTVGYMDTDFLKDGIVNVSGNASGSSSGSSSGSGSTSSGSYAKVNASALYLRSSASKSSRSLGLFPRGTQVTVLEQGNTWCKVRVDGITGYMMTQYLNFYGLPAVASATVTHPQRTFVYLRSGPSQSSGNILLKVPHGAEVTVLVPGSTWTQVKYKGKTGYMMSRYLD